MAYINDHKSFRSEEMVIGNVSADVGLGPGADGVANQGRSGPAAHSDPFNMGFDWTGTSGDPKSKAELHESDEFLRLHWLGKITDRA